MKPVRVGWQIIATIFLPTGLYAFKRISKLGYGTLLYIVTFMYAVATGTISVIFFNELGDLVWFIAISDYIIPFLIPMLFIAKWSRQWNESLAKPTFKDVLPTN